MSLLSWVDGYAETIHSGILHLVDCGTDGLDGMAEKTNPED